MTFLAAACCMALGLAGPPLAQGYALPQVTHLEADNGPQGGGNTVAISGVGFTQSPIASVKFATKAATRFTVVSGSLIDATAPAGSGEAEVIVTNARGEASPATPADRYAYDAPPSEPWLGLDGNSSHSLGPIDAFVEHRVVYDRSGPVEWMAGETLKQNGSGLSTSIAAGMIPVVTIEFNGYSNCSWGSDCMPSGEAAVQEYVKGFVASAGEMLAKYPSAGILLEAINEPWGYGTAAQYAAILAKLLPAAEQAHIPLTRLYAGATKGGWVRALYASQPQLQTEVQGWYMHPYDTERRSGEGISSLPAMHAEMTSGQNNVIVSEMGFCAPNVNNAHSKCKGGPAPTRDSKEAATLLTEQLQAAVPFHREGWLRALLVYSRNDSGWAMQLEGGALTRSGEALDAFADSYG